VFDRRSAGLGWVPVPNEEDEPDAWAAFEFPPDHELWLIYNYEQGREIGFRRDGAWWVANTDRAMWVTHMQPLPAPPEGE
jgi:hypothetical protein